MARLAKKTSKSKTGLSSSPSIPPIPHRILSGDEPIAERYSGNWDPVDLNQQAVSEGDLEDATDKMDKALRPELFFEESEPEIAPAGGKIHWKSTQRELVSIMDSLRIAGKIEARNESDMIRQIVKHFTCNGKPLDENSLRVNLQQYRDRIAGRK